MIAFFSSIAIILSDIFFRDNRGDTILREIFLIKGRINRKKYLIYWLFVSIFPLVILFVGYSLDIYIVKLSYVLCLFLEIVAHICLAIRRLQDINRHGAIAFVLLIPIFSFFLQLYLFTVKGTEGYNCYGPDPLDNIEAAE